MLSSPPKLLARCDSVLTFKLSWYEMASYVSHCSQDTPYCTRRNADYCSTGTDLFGVGGILLCLIVLWGFSLVTSYSGVIYLLRT